MGIPFRHNFGEFTKVHSLVLNCGSCQHPLCILSLQGDTYTKVMKLMYKIKMQLCAFIRQLFLTVIAKGTRQLGPLASELSPIQ